MSNCNSKKDGYAGDLSLNETGKIVLPKEAKDGVRGFDTGEYAYETRLGRKEYEAQKSALQVELLKLQHWVQETGQKFVLLFEGRDAAGKGGTIKRFTEHLKLRSARVTAPEIPRQNR